MDKHKHQLTPKQKVAKPPADGAKPRGRGRPRKQPVEEEEEEETDKQQWTVESILDDGIDGKTKEHKYLIKWEGFPDATWEPRKNLTGCDNILDEYEKQAAKTKAGAKTKTPLKAKTKTPTKAKTPTQTKAKTGRPPGRPKKNA